MSHEEQMDLAALLEEKRRVLEQAASLYGRSLSADEYWWLGVGLAAWTLADLGERPYAAGRLEQLMDRLGQNGVKGDWLQRFVEELAELDAEGLLWPVYQRSAAGPVEPTGVAVHPAFGPQEGYFLALAHIAVALAVSRDDRERIGRLAGAIGEMVETGLTASHEQLILTFLQGEGGQA